MASNPESAKKVEECLTKVKTMEKQKEDSEKIISEISSVLEEICGDNDSCFESAPLKYQLACVLIDNVHDRMNSEESESKDEGLDQDDLDIAWENLESARLLYSNAENGKDYRKEIADIYMKQGEICLANEDYENALIDHKKALELRQQICSPISREVADSDFFIGIASYCNAKAHALLSKTDASLKEDALKNAAESVTHLKNAKHIMEHYAVDKAIEMGILKTEKVTDENRSELMEELKKMKDIPSEVEELLSIVEDIDVDVKAASEFSIEKVIEEEKNSVSLLRDLLQEQEEDDDDDEDFSEEEEEEDDDDVVIEDVEELKRSVKRIGESLPDNAKEAKHESFVCYKECD